MSTLPPPPPPPPPPQQHQHVHQYQTSAPTHRDAYVDAKASKARAKALRPFYRKKRYWILSAFTVVIIAAAAGSDNTKTTNATAVDPDTGAILSADPVLPTVAEVSTGFGSRDASADVVKMTLGAVNSLGLLNVSATVTNHSSERSNYYIEVSLESPDGAIQYDTTMLFVNNLDPGQTTESEAFPFSAENVPAGAVPVVKTVSRTASG